MTDIDTERLVLHPLELDEAKRVYDRAPSADDRWASGYPFEDELDALAPYIDSLEGGGDIQPFGLYQIRHEGVAVGGIGFSGPPDDGVVELGFGLIESARGSGFAAEALEALIETALAFGAERVIADTTLDNLASQKTMLRAGMSEVARDEELIHFEAR